MKRAFLITEVGRMTHTLETTTRWASETTVTLQRYQFEDAVRALPKLDALRLIRAAYGCSLEDARVVLTLIGGPLQIRVGV